MNANYFRDIGSLEELKKRYKELAFRFHPDRQPDAERSRSTAIMQEINNEYQYFCEHPTFTYKFEGDKEDLLVYPEVLMKIINLNGIVIELIGAWLWVSGNTIAYKKELKEAGFWYAPKKQMWYFRPDGMKSHKHDPLDIHAIRNKYGSDVIQQKEQGKIR